MRASKLVLVLTTALFAAPLAAEENVQTIASGLIAQHREALVTVRLTAKMRAVYQGRQQTGPESTIEISGTVISPSGLTVVSDVSGSPSGPFQGGGEARGIETETSDTKIVLRDGRELPAKFVLRDRDLDLAFVLPDEKGLNLPALTLGKAPTLGPLDDLIFLYALGKVHNREIAVSLSRVRAIVRKPRTFVLADFITSLQALGCPVFNTKGELVGVTVMRRPPSAAGAPESLRDVLDLMSAVVLQAEDIREVAQQAEKAATAQDAKPIAR
ncbi:MAG: serine protease [Vicinamibacteria bacterium]|jgi:hypothetical protein|nr:serine protease [Vicinamibacteria bacterium]